MKEQSHNHRAAKVIRAEQDVQNNYHHLLQETEDPHIRSILRDLLLYEEMNELILRDMYKI
ncbi:MAG: hypothetical protein AAB733_00970 [Patescibacteria group bacterium]